MVAGFNETLLFLGQEIDFFTGILPFLISFVLFDQILKQVDLFGGSDAFEKKPRKILSLSFAALVTYFVITTPLYQQFFVQYFGRLAIGIIGLLGLVMLLAMVGWNPTEHPVNGFIILALLLAFGAFSVSNGLFAFLPTQSLAFGMSLQEIFAFIVDSGLGYIIIIGAAVYWASSEKDDEDSEYNTIIDVLTGSGSGQ